MDKKQYEEMQSIVQFGRLAVDAMLNAMKRCGLIENGYWLEMAVRNIYLPSTGETMIGSVRLNRPYDNENYRHDEDFYHMELRGKGWEIIDDPCGKTGSVPTVVKPCDFDPTGADEGSTAGEKASEHPLPPDGLWLSSRDDPAYVGGGQ